MKPRAFIRVGSLPMKETPRAEVAEHMRRNRQDWGKIERRRYPDGSKYYTCADLVLPHPYSPGETTTQRNPYAWIIAPPQ